MQLYSTSSPSFFFRSQAYRICAKGFPALSWQIQRETTNCYFIQAFRPTHQWKPRQSRMILSYLDFCLFRKQWTQMLPLLVWLSSFIPCRYLEALYSSLKITPASFYVRSTVGSSTTWNRNLILADRLVCRPYRNYHLQLYNLRTADKWHRKITATRTGQFLSQNTQAKTWWCALQRYRSYSDIQNAHWLVLAVATVIKKDSIFFCPAMNCLTLALTHRIHDPFHCTR